MRSACIPEKCEVPCTLVQIARQFWLVTETSACSLAKSYVYDTTLYSDESVDIHSCSFDQLYRIYFANACTYGQRRVGKREGCETLQSTVRRWNG